MPRRALDSYKRLCTEFYDLDKPRAPQEALRFYWEQYEAGGGGPVLEAMCGSGRFLVPFAERGAAIDGVDASAEMLAACARRLAAAGLQAGLHEQFLQELDVTRRYRYVFCPAGSFALVPREEQAGALAALARHMEPGGTLALEMLFAGETREAAGGMAERRVQRADGAEIVLSAEPSGAMRYDLVRDGAVVETEYETFVLHPAERGAFERMLAAAGFVDVRALWPYTGEEARPGASMAVYVCRREGARQ